MRKILTLSLIFLLLLGCASPAVERPATEEPAFSPETGEPSSDADLPPTETPQAETLPPVETRPPEADYAPAFAGQTRIGGVKTKVSLKTEIITAQLDQPWGIVSAPDGRLFVTEKSGSLRIIDHSDISPAIGGFPAIQTSGQGGLLDLALSPDFSSDRLIYFTFSEASPQGAVTAVGHGRLSQDETVLEDFTVIFRALPYYAGSGHFGSRLAFADDGTLFVTTGDRQSNDTRMKAQELDNGYGKVLHLSPSGDPAGDYFPDQPEAWREIYSYGHRNLQGLAIDPQTGDIWVSEMGPRGGDELNLILPGKNYGWPLVSYGIEYSGARVSQGETQMEGTEQPVYYWDPVLAPSGMTFYDASAIAEWQNNLFITGLRGSHISRLILQDHRVAGEERLLSELGERFRDVTVGQDGALYTITDSGKLYRLGLGD